MLVYLITNLIDGKRYIGQTTKSLAWRWWKHRKTPGCHYLYRAIQKHGKENFSTEVLCEPPTESLLNEMENYFIDRYRTLAPNGYNLTTGGHNARPCEVTRQKMRASHKGQRGPSSFSENWTGDDKEKARQRMIGNKHLLGHSPSEETRRKISESMKKRRQIDSWSCSKTKPESERRQTYDAIRHRNGLK